MILLAETEITTAVGILGKLRARVQEAYVEHEKKRISCTITIGVTQTDPFHFESTIQESDKAVSGQTERKEPGYGLTNKTTRPWDGCVHHDPGRLCLAYWSST